MARTFLLILFTLSTIVCIAQKQKKPAKPQVIVYGHEADAFSAAIQSAESGVETIWIIDSTAIGGALIIGEPKSITTNQSLDAGSWAVFLKGIANVKELSDSAVIAAKKMITPRIAQNVFEGIADTVKRLTVKKHTTILQVEKSGKGWQVTLSNKERIKAKALVDASQQGTLKELIRKETKHPEILFKNDTTKSLIPQISYNKPLYRTGIAVTQEDEDIFNVPLSYMLPDSALATLFVTRPQGSLSPYYTDVNSTPLLMLLGQASGAAAAYCAFFNTTADKINTRTIQGELLGNKSFLLPFQDISLQDPHYQQIQRIGATGILQGHYNRKDGQKQFLFYPDSLVSSAEIEPITKQIYTRSQIWFKDKQIATLTLKDLLSLIKYVANRGDELDAEIEKGWAKRFKFKGSYDLSRKLTRREFAVLTDIYLQPFFVRVNFNGDFQY
ncbi:hypothetical protein GCM10023231_08710 [Olivibacter ginsenosidimutans]|uniref:FAD-dependent oxidoreductase n=1 Tax=Olivibacter ginsenosidimutans TaxID=1176537 RepID=A0ABP9ALV4_9SPHI